MGIDVDPLIWAGYVFLWFFLTLVLVIGLGLGWKFRLRPEIRARQKHAQALMIILCYIIGVGWGVSSLLFILVARNEDFGVQIGTIYGLVLCMTFCHYASMNVYFYRVWRLYYKCKLQNAFEKVRENPATLNQRSLLSQILSLTMNSRTSAQNILNEQSEHLISWPKEVSVRKSWFVRYRRTLGRSQMNKVFWSFLWFCQCNIIYWTQKTRGHDRKTLTWSPNDFADDFFTVFFQLMCIIVLFVFPSDDLFRIKTELRLIFIINTVETALYYMFEHFDKKAEAYLNLAICEFCIMVAITFSNYRAVRNQSLRTVGPIVREVSRYSDKKLETELRVTDVLECQTLFQAFEKHLKREFSLEHINFIVDVVHYRRMWQERHRKQNEKIRKIFGEDSHPRTEQISMQVYNNASIVCGSDNSNISAVSSTTIPSNGTLSRVGGDFESPSSVPYRSSPSRRVSRPTPTLNWLNSQNDVGADKQTRAFFIFTEYCDRGAPQEINLSKKDRDQLVDFFSSSELEEDLLSTIFDRAFDSVLDLLENDSLRRFRMNSCFNQYTENLFVKNVYDINQDRKSMSCRQQIM
jgi:hypothetical protein